MKSVLVHLSGAIAFLVVVLASSFIAYPVGGTGKEGDILTQDKFIDDMGNVIELKGQCKRIISLSPTHTENLFDLGAEGLLIGVDESSVFPFEATLLPGYDFTKKLDLERLIEASPDVVLIEPVMNLKYTASVSALEAAGIKVISLMPSSLDDFQWYVRKLGLITGFNKEVDDLIEAFYQGLDVFRTDNQPSKTVFMESSEKGYRTPGPGTLPYEALRLTGIRQLIKESRWFATADLDYVEIPETVIFDNNTSIDAVISLKGDGYSGGDIPSLKQHKVTGSLNAVREGEVYLMKSPLIGRYTRRYHLGIRELKRLVYGDRRRLSLGYSDNDPLTRDRFASLLYEYLTLPTFVVYSKDYYAEKKYHHTYGAFEDVNWRDDDFNSIETVVMRSYLQPVKEDDKEYFGRDSMVSGEELGLYIYHRKNIRGEILRDLLKEQGINLEDVDTVGEMKYLLEVTEQWP